MELNKTRKWLYISTATWLATTLALGAWWLYLVIKLAKLLEVNKIPLQSNLYKMLKWEGIFFFTLLTVLTITVFYLFSLDLKKSQAIRAFFASLTHELKTPLANIRMQSEIIKEQSKSIDDALIEKNVQRLIQGSQELEQEFDKMLQLSRAEDGGQLNLHSLNLFRYLNNSSFLKNDDLHVNISNESGKSDILVDDYALKVIFSNLVQNSLKHNNQRPLTLNLKIEPVQDKVRVLYSESTPVTFSGKVEKLGSLFYKWNSYQGSGIGLYLIKKLMNQMKGKLIIHLSEQGHLSFELIFQGQENDSE